MTYPEMQRYAAAIGIDQYWFFAFLASDEIGVLPPFITVEVGAFTEKGYAEILKIVQELGPKHLIVNGTKQYQMEIIAVESQAYQELMDRLQRIEQYIDRTSHLLQDIDDELEMSTKDLIETLSVSESTLYRWRKKQLIRYRYTESRDVRYFFKSIVIAVKCNRLRISGMRSDEVLGRLNRFKDNLIMSSCLNPQNR